MNSTLRLIRSKVEGHLDEYEIDDWSDGYNAGLRRALAEIDEGALLTKRTDAKAEGNEHDPNPERN